jgi:hypothetical protein
MAISNNLEVLALFRSTLVNRHDHTKGTLIIRPSVNCAVMVSSETAIVEILGSFLTTMFLPYFDYFDSLVE